MQGEIGPSVAGDIVVNVSVCINNSVLYTKQQNI